MVKCGNRKYFRFLNRDWPEQLFDLAADPWEMYNRIDDPAYADAAMHLRGKLDAIVSRLRKSVP